jgi:hypothetical protein
VIATLASDDLDSLVAKQRTHDLAEALAALLFAHRTMQDAALAQTERPHGQARLRKILSKMRARPDHRGVEARVTKWQGRARVGATEIRDAAMR